MLRVRYWWFNECVKSSAEGWSTKAQFNSFISIMICTFENSLCFISSLVSFLVIFVDFVYLHLGLLFTLCSVTSVQFLPYFRSWPVCHCTLLFVLVFLCVQYFLTCDISCLAFLCHFSFTLSSPLSPVPRCLPLYLCPIYLAFVSLLTSSASWFSCHKWFPTCSLRLFSSCPSSWYTVSCAATSVCLLL